MGYSTEFRGALCFTTVPSIGELKKLKTFLEEDCRDHPEWERTDLTYINLELIEDFSGLEWNGSEKTYDLVEKINLIITEMQKDFPNFGLEGELLAQGEDMDDRYIIKMENNKAVTMSIQNINQKVCCPYCNKSFTLLIEK